MGGGGRGEAGGGGQGGGAGGMRDSQDVRLVVGSNSWVRQRKIGFPVCSLPDCHSEGRFPLSLTPSLKLPLK